MKSVLRFLISGDLQIHAWKQFARTLPNGRNSRLENTLKVIDILREEAKKRGISKVILNGDILEESDEIKTDTYNALYERLESLHTARLDTILSLGNHDIVSRSNENLVHSLKAFRSIARIAESPLLAWDKVCIVPYQNSPKVLKRILRHLSPPRGASVLAAHVGLEEGYAGPNHVRIKTGVHLSDVQRPGFRLVLLSDIHARQRITKGVYYLGSPIQHNFGETHEPCIWEVRLYDEHPWYKLIPIPTNLPRFVVANCATESDVRNCLESNPGNYVRLRLSGTKSGLSDEYIEHLGEENKCLLQIIRESEESEKVKIPEIANFEKTIWKYAGTKRLAKLGLELFR